MKREGGELNPRVFVCPNCGSTQVETRMVRDKFQYGSGARSVVLEACIPFRKCMDCEFEYTDSEAEDLRHEAVCRHLGVMTPAEIIALRKKYELTRAQFSERSRIGEASLARWETGEFIQNPANDDYLYLLSFPDNLERLENRRKGQQTCKEPDNVVKLEAYRFKALAASDISKKQQEAKEFQLRPEKARCIS